MRQELVWKRHWLDDSEYNRTWQLSKLALGIQQIAQVILYGRRLGGWPGLALALLAFLLPSVAVTIAMSSILVSALGNRFVQDALRLIIPLTGGMTMALALQMWNPQLRSLARDWLRLVCQGIVVLVCAILLGVVHVPVPIVMLLAIVGGALLPA